MRARAIALITLTLALVAGCAGEKPTGARSTAGTYTLRTLNGHAVPYEMTYHSGSAEAHVRYLASQITLRGDGTYGAALVAEVVVCYDGDCESPEHRTITGDGTYLAGGGELTFDSGADDDDFDLEAPNCHFSLHGDRLTMLVRVDGESDMAFVYAK